MEISSRYVPTAWSGSGAMCLDRDIAQAADGLLDSVVDLMVAVNQMPADLPPAARYGRAMSAVLRDGFESRIDALTLALQPAKLREVNHG
ncbi:MAG: hypothetical protein MOGMAGMI_02448 [Candidatus Omnitrophica bacterium]|nr:hypothetical protein [Candidatus Omnitrophota bacterium]